MRTITMKVLKRGSRGLEEVKFDKITRRLSGLCNDLKSVDCTAISQMTIARLCNGIKTEQLDGISATAAESCKLIHPEYSTLAARILVSNLHKTTPATFSECMAILARSLSNKSSIHYDFIARNAAALDAMVVHSNDYLFDYIGFRTLTYSYLNKVDGVIIDRPQYMYLRAAIAININTSSDINVVLANIKTCYDLLSNMYYTQATPTYFNACESVQQLQSCFVLAMHDSIEGIMKTLTDASLISKRAGGIGFCTSEIRSRGSLIKGTNGQSSGLPKILKQFNEAARCWDQGGRRKGAFAAYIEPWHGDIMKFLELKLSQGHDIERARDLFYGLWVPDLFVKRVIKGYKWSLFSPSTAPGLCDVYDGMEVCELCGYCSNPAYSKYLMGPSGRGTTWGASESTTGSLCSPSIRGPHDGPHVFGQVDAFTQLYQHYEAAGLATEVVEARDVLTAICTLQKEAGVPYVCFKDFANRMTNQKNVGTIKSSNLCSEIFEWFDETSYACCTLASINLKKYLVGCMIDHSKLYEVVRSVVRYLDIIIDENVYPVPECRKNATELRPIAVGIGGLADVFAAMRIPFDSEEAARVDMEIAETIYFAAVHESTERARTHGAYSKFAESPASQGVLQPDMWLANQQTLDSFLKTVGKRSAFVDSDGVIRPRYSGRYDPDEARARIAKYGCRNSLHLAFMPTVSTSQILGNNESFEPFSSNLYTKTTLASKFTITNTAMINHLIELGLWSEQMKNRIVNNNGSVQNIEEIPEAVRNIYKTVWEIPQKTLMKRTAARSAWVCQSQSLNIHAVDNSLPSLRSIFLASWQMGNKTGSYYIRTQPGAQALKNNIADSRAEALGGQLAAPPTCQLDGVCTSCSG